MSAATLTIAYGSDSVSFSQFGSDDLPRSILQQASLEFSPLGTAYSTGIAKKQKRIWAVSAFGTVAQWTTLMTIFDAWDEERVTGSNIAEVTITDNLLGGTVTATAFFTTAPSISKVAPGNNEIFAISFGLTET